MNESLVNQDLLEILNSRVKSLKEVMPARKRAHYRAITNWATKFNPKQSKNDFEKLRGYLESFHHFCKVEDWEAAKEILLAKSPDAEDDYYWQVGKLGYYREQISVLEIILGKLEKHDDITWLNSLGIAFRRLGEYEQAIDFFQKGLQVSLDFGKQKSECAFACNLGNLYRDLGQYEQAIDHHKRALNISRNIKDLQREGMCLGNLGIAYRDTAQYKQAIDALNKYLNISKSLNYSQGEAIALNDLGLTYAYQGNYGEAVKTYENGLCLMREIKDRRGETFCLFNLGVAQQHLGQYEEAMRSHKLSLTLSKDSGDLRAQGNALGYLGCAQMETAQFTEALSNIRQALSIFQDIKAPSKEAEFLMNLSKVYKMMGNINLALEHCQKSVDLAKKLGIPLSEECEAVLKSLQNPI